MSGKELSRRKFLTTMAVAGAAIPFTNIAGQSLMGNKVNDYPIYFFTKLLDGFETEFMTETLSMAGGIAGLDVTVRPKGKVEPEVVETELPKVIETARKYGFKTNMMTTAITGPDDDYIRNILKTASSLGIKHYRLGDIKYDNTADVWGFLQNLKKQIAGIVELNEEYKIQAGIQNHASNAGFGSPLWDVWEIIREMPVEYISSQYDVRHSSVEGYSSWILALRMLSNNIGALVIKDYNWEIANGKAKPKHVPTGEGLVDFDAYFQEVKRLNIIVPITLHVEYQLLSESEKSLPLLQQQKIIVPKIKKEIEFIQGHLDKM